MLLQTGKYILAKIAIISPTSHWNAAGTSLDRKSVTTKCHLHRLGFPVVSVAQSVSAFGC